MSGEQAPLMLWIEGVVALVIMLAFVVSSFFAFEAEHGTCSADNALTKLDAIERRSAAA